ncbi:MAG: SpoIID/LytB domain-containing protein [Schwartzia sp.]|nr:SpoIID/LytB domain-containing protein [Schwartzia sp. (in: firmicutes)]
MMKRYVILFLLGLFCAVQGLSPGVALAAVDRPTVGAGIPGAVTKTNPETSEKKALDEAKKEASPSRTEAAEPAEKEEPTSKNEAVEKPKPPKAGKDESTEPLGRVAKPEPRIRVGLSEGQISAVVTSDAAYALSDVKTEREIEKIGAGKQTTVTVKSGALVVNGKTVAAKALRFVVADDRTARHLAVAGEKYRGHIVLSLAADGTITVINEVKLDDYIGGVISEEMSPDWPSEALKAQAVAARTFAVYSLGLHDEDGYDVCTTTHCQVYGGIESESPEGLRAVSATRGEILTYQGKAIYAAFHASSGGMTAGSEEAGGMALPYLKPVRDSGDQATPNRHWQVSLSVRELSSKLAASGFSVGSLKALGLTPLKVGQGAPDRYPSGRVEQVRFVGSKQTVSVSGTKLRWMLGLPGTLFEIHLDKEAAKGKIDLSGKDTAKLVFDGYGRGHGIGLAQWGAKAMAAQKQYREILGHYYKGVEFTFIF